jgi:hypothetical protein
MSVMTPNHSERAPAMMPHGVPAPVSEPAAPVSEQAARLLAIVGMAGIAVIHVLDAPDTFAGVKYIFWLYIAIIAGAIPFSLLLLQWSSRLAWVGPALLAAGPLLGYLLTRSVGLPGDSGDIGNWLDSLGLASMFVETAVLSLSLARLGAGSRWFGRRGPRREGRYPAGAIR